MSPFKKQLKFYRYLLPFWRLEALALILTGITILSSLVNPYLTKLIIDKAYANKDLKLFIILIAIGGLVFISNGIINGLSGYINRYIRIRVNFNLNRDVFAKLQNLHYGFFQSSSTGENLYKIGYDVERVTGYIIDTLPQPIFLLFRSLSILAVLLYLNWKMALFALALTPFLYIVPYYITNRLKRALNILMGISQDIFRQVQEILTHIQLVKAFGKEKFENRRYIKSLIKRIRSGLKNTKLEISISFMNSIANRIVSGLIVCYGGYQLIRGRMTLGNLSAITLYISQLSGLQSSFASLFQQITLGTVSCERLETILDAPAQIIEDKRAKEIKFSSGGIEFRGATFGYNKQKAVLENLTFSIEGGSRIALAGFSGCGKTTIINLILRLYNLQDGRMLIDGCDIKDIKSKSLYEQIGAVLQEPFLWNDSIKNNILYARPKAIEEELKQIARICLLDRFVEDLPNKYETIIGENACKISEGQKQKIAIARALIKNPRILILDEAMSSMDSASEERVMRNIKEAYKGITIISVSHRLSTVTASDLAYFLKKPDEIVIDSPERLLEQDEEFRNLFAAQITRKICDNVIKG